MNGARVVVVTGASAGIGRATARLFGARGDRVALIARGEQGLANAAEEVAAAGATALAVPVDVADHDALAEAADRVERELGPIDVWVNNAFTTVFAPFLAIRPDEFRRVTEVTYLGFVHGTRVALQRMLPRNRGTIVQVGSALAYRAIPLQSAYCGAKHAIQGFTESVRCELMHDGSAVRVTMVQLPAMNTPQFDWALSRMRRKARPVPPIYQPDVAARAIVRAADHPRRREYWVGASTAGTLLANKVAPGLLDRYLARTGYDAQQTSTKDGPNRPANLWEPVDDRRGVGPDPLPPAGGGGGKAQTSVPGAASTTRHNRIARSRRCPGITAWWARHSVPRRSAWCGESCAADRRKDTFMVDLLVLLLRALLVVGGGPAGRVAAILGAILVLRFLLGSGTRGARSG